jgi:hypothetical protein
MKNDFILHVGKRGGCLETPSYFSIGNVFLLLSKCEMHVFRSFNKLDWQMHSRVFSQILQNLRITSGLCVHGLLCMCRERTFSSDGFHCTSKECKVENYCDISVIFSVRFPNQNFVCYLLYPHTCCYVFRQVMILAACFFFGLRMRWRRWQVNKFESK